MDHQEGEIESASVDWKDRTHTISSDQLQYLEVRSAWMLSPGLRVIEQKFQATQIERKTKEKPEKNG